MLPEMLPCTLPIKVGTVIVLEKIALLPVTLPDVLMLPPTMLPAVLMLPPMILPAVLMVPLLALIVGPLLLVHRFG